MDEQNKPDEHNERKQLELILEAMLQLIKLEQDNQTRLSQIEQKEDQILAILNRTPGVAVSVKSQFEKEK
jgi:hypothetical protein